MRKHNCVWDKLKQKEAVSNKHAVLSTKKLQSFFCLVLTAYCLVLTSGCATPQYTIRGTPIPDESISAVRIERAISDEQAKELQKQDARPIGNDEQLAGYPIQSIIEKLKDVSERPHLPYRALVYTDKDPNAIALADGRVYLSTGMIEFLSERGAREDELAFILAHELAHTVAQHLVKRYYNLQKQQVLMSIISAGTAAITRGASSSAQQAGRLAVDAASLLRNVAVSGYSQSQELEADQLGIRYLIRAGYNPMGALDMLRNFSQFEQPGAFLRTHPYIATRYDHLIQYLSDTGALQMRSPATPPTISSAPHDSADPSVNKRTHSTHNEQAAHLKLYVSQRIRQLKQVQQFYPQDSISWINLQRQIEALQKQ